METMTKTLDERVLKAVRDHAALEDHSIIDAGIYGADGGFGGFVYYADCNEFYNKNEDLIYELLYWEAEELGEENIATMISKFRRADMLDFPDGRRCLLSWFALEHAGRYLERKEKEKV